MLPVNYARLENSQKIQMLRDEVLRSVLKYEFRSRYGRSWWKETLLPQIQRMAGLSENDLDETTRETARKYAVYLADLKKKNASPSPDNMDTSVMSTPLLFDKAFEDLTCRRDEQKRDALHRLRIDRNESAHEGMFNRSEQEKSLQLMKNVIRLYGGGVFEPDVVDAVQNYDFDAAERARQAAYKKRRSWRP